MTPAKASGTLFVVTLVIALVLLFNWDLDSTLSGSPAPTNTPEWAESIEP